ncbi:winged helix-turn-helix domain-containing protein [Yinghuangia sp. YIM S10712]|uniref:winged helix-turn-helix domain-containing protein n=1 Tax=Yinghuangia sp. YIM S10712 TaxID=3436930 RepID=UPI003F5366A3
MSTRHVGAQTKSERIAADLRKELQSGRYKVGDKIPSYKTLAATYGCAEQTVINAVQDLQRAGLLESLPGSGTYVRQTEAPGEESCECHELAELRAELEGIKQRLDAIESSRATAVDS